MIPLNYIRIGGVLLAVLGVFYFGYSVGNTKAENAANKEKAALLEVQKQALIDAQTAYAEELTKQRQADKSSIEKLTKDKAITDEKYRAAINPNSIGLRIPKAVCNNGMPAEASTAQRTDETSTVRLPRQIESDLYQLARESEDIANQLSALQSWVNSLCSAKID